MKKSTLILLTATLFIIISSCINSHTDNLQSNGLSYMREGFIGPDSCELFYCFLKGGGGVYMTRCKHDHSLEYRSGKTSQTNTIVHLKPQDKTWTVNDTTYIVKTHSQQIIVQDTFIQIKK